jgi:glutamate carboxypeptidase
MKQFDPSSIPSAQSMDSEDLLRLGDWAKAHQDDMTADLRTLVGVDTPSTSKTHLQRGLDWIERWLETMLGPPEARLLVDGGELGDTLVLDYAGAGSRPVLLLCHYDTVWEADTSTHWPFQVSGSIATGPGVFDMKAGLVQAVWGLRGLRELGLRHPPVRLLLNGSEEVGSPLRSVIETAAEDTAAVLNLEPSADGAVKTSRKGVGIWEIEVTGLEAHAGIEPRNGASAVHELARIITELRGHEALDRGTSVNFGTIEGGTRSNVIAGRASASLDVRTEYAAESARMEAAITALTPSDDRLSLEVRGGWNRPVLERSPLIGAMFDLARAIAARQGWTLSESPSGGGSDSNFLSASGVPLLDGLGPVGAGAHSRSEQVELSAMPQRSALVATIVHAFAEH